MKSVFTFMLFCAVALLPMTAGTTAPETDWPQWRGPLRDGKSTETGLPKQWPEKGPAVSWSIANLGEGYGSLAIRGNRIYVQGTKDKESAVFCLNRADGKTIWSVSFGQWLAQDKGNGPRGAPMRDGDKLYVLTENGELACLKESDGSRVWHARRG
jgi:outer membrane protein assembly factor BamB